jgi:hypothetical protein
MMALGIVGHAADKFTPHDADRARAAIRQLILRHNPQWVISGRSPLGGVDVWAIEEARRLGFKTFEFAPRVNSWGAPGGYRDRNLQIAKKCDHVAVIVLRHLKASSPKGFVFPACYHCEGQSDYPGPHVKSGGCWTARRAQSREWVIL